MLPYWNSDTVKKWKGDSQRKEESKPRVVFYYIIITKRMIMGFYLINKVEHSVKIPQHDTAIE
jgi:hypothetical protein